MDKVKIIFIILLLGLIPSVLYTQSMRDYCISPPYVTRSVPPNIMFIIDNSSSMLQPFYMGEYIPEKAYNYSGYFEYDKKYCASSSGFYEAEKCEYPDKGPYPGSLLNWATMSRYDIMMKVLIGGLGTPEPSSRKKLKGINQANEKTTTSFLGCIFKINDEGNLIISNEGSCKLPETYPEGVPVVISLQEYGAVKNIGVIQNLADSDHDGIWDNGSPRIGIISYSSNQTKIFACCTENSGSIAEFINKNISLPDKKWIESPLYSAIQKSIDYFKNECSNCSCRKDPSSSVHCRKNIVVVAGSGDATDYIYNLNNLIRESHVGDIRKDIKGMQNIIFYSIHIAGTETGKNFLKEVARNGGFLDINQNNKPDESEWDMNEDNMPDTYFEASDTEDFLASIESIIQDIAIGFASGTAVTILTNGEDKAGGIYQAFYSPLRYDSSNELRWLGYLQSLWLDPDKNIREDTSNDFKLILDQDKIVRYNSEDLNSSVSLFSTDIEGIGCPSESGQPKSLEEVKAIWEAGRQLFKKSPSERVIYTSSNIIRGENKIISGSGTVFFNTEMNSGMKDSLFPERFYTADSIIKYVRGECLETFNSEGKSCGTKRNPLFRDRRVYIDGNRGVWKLGDIVNSSPKLFHAGPVNAFHTEYGDFSYFEFISDDNYSKSFSVIFAGSNDGMLHAFRAGYLQNSGLLNNVKAVFKRAFNFGEEDHGDIGEEIWAFIPYNAFPYLKYLANPYYCHIPYVDLSVKIVDASISGGEYAEKTKGSWRSILIGGMRFGGSAEYDCKFLNMQTDKALNAGFSSYFAIDITNPEKPMPLWEFSDTDLGYTTSMPAIVRIGEMNRNGKWFVVFGSGSDILPKASIDIGRSKKGYLYILDLYSGELIKKISLDYGGVNHIVSDISSIDADMNYTSEKIYFGTSYRTSNKWKGNIFSLDIEKMIEVTGSQKNISWSDISHNGACSVLFIGDYPFTASPVAVKDAKGDIWVYAGSGKYYGDIDEKDKSQQIFIGFKDIGKTFSEDNFIDTTNDKTRVEVLDRKEVCIYDPSAKRFVVKKMPSAVKLVSGRHSEPKNGWKIYLPAGQRIISRPMLYGGLADFVSYEPESDICSYGGSSYLYALEYNTGIAPSNIAILSPDAIAENGSSEIIIKSNIKIGSGAPAYGEAILTAGTQKQKEQIRKKIQLTTGAVVEIENKPLFSVYSRIMHWLKK
jgi:type IV pilus assembly protein PilY1